MDDIEQAFSQIRFFLEALKENNTHVLTDSDLDDLSKAIRLVDEASSLCVGEWRENPLRKWIEGSGGHFRAKKY